MGKYVNYKIAGYWVYYTQHCLGEGVIHVHASNNGRLTEAGQQKLWVHSDGSSTVARMGSLKPWELEGIQAWIFKNHLAIRDTWIMYNKNSMYMGK